MTPSTCTSSLRAILTAGLLAQAHLASAVTLADFNPRSTNLTPACEAVYTTYITGCTAADFEPVSSSSSSGGGGSGSGSSSCSSSCLNGLVAINTEVLSACSGAAQNDNMLIAAFLNGKGIQDLCSNVVVTTIQAANNVAQTSTTTMLASTTASASITTTSVLTITSPSSSGSVIVMGGETMAGTSTLTDNSPQETGTLSGGIIVDTGSPSPVHSPTSSTITTTISGSTITTETLSASVTSPPIVVTATSSNGATDSVISSTSTTTVTANGMSSTASTTHSPTACASADHGGSPFDYCNSASSLTGYIETMMAGFVVLVFLSFLF